MQFVKKNAVMLGGGGVSLLAIVMLILGMMDSSVADEMSRRVSAAGQISSLRADPKNDAIIASEKERAERVARDLKSAFEKLLEMNQRKPLIAEAFPRPRSMTQATEFRIAYVEALAALLRELDAGDLPNNSEIEEEQQNVNDQMETERAAAEEADPSMAAAPPVRGGAAPPGVSIGGGGSGRAGGAAAAPGMLPAGADPDDIKYNAERRAQIAKARSIRIYAGPDALHRSPIAESQAAPNVIDMWFAQVSLWIQQDILRAIREINDEAARADGDGTVETSPIKRIERFRIFGYVSPEGKIIEFPAAAAAVVAGTTGTATQIPGVGEMRRSFTQRKADEQFDVVRLTLIVTVDSRDLPLLFDRISRQNLYVCTHVDLTRSNDPMFGFVYGPEPVIRATMDFECYMARSAFAEMMPPDVLKALGGNPPEPTNP